MGRGDRRTRKGKQFRASHGNTRGKGGKKKDPVAAPAPASPAPKAGRGKS
ncbi:MAG TPA: 30S ribosomal protein THX [Burkholderiales bacterium]